MLEAVSTLLATPAEGTKPGVPGEDERLDLRLLILFVTDLAKLVHLIKNGELALLVLLAVPVAARTDRIYRGTA